MRQLKRPLVDAYELDGRMYRTRNAIILGSGTEGSVIAHPDDPDSCVKLFHPVDASDLGLTVLADQRSSKLHEIKRMHGLKRLLPGSVVLPQQLAYRPYGSQEAIGYQMRRLSARYAKIKSLLDPAFRERHGVTLKDVVLLFANLFDDLEVIHQQGLVVGDINLGCVMFSPEDHEYAWVDVDSWSFPRHECVAFTEMFAHPELYGHFTPGSRLVSPLPKHDRFAFTVMFTQMAIPGAHPFIMGQHRQVGGIQNRAREGITIFDKDVVYPPILPAWQMLSDDLLQALVLRLKRRTHASLDTAMLRTFAAELNDCPSCEVQFHQSRTYCPQCGSRAKRPQPVASFRAQKLCSVPTIVHAQTIDNRLHLLAKMGKNVYVTRVSPDGALRGIPPQLPHLRNATYRFFRNNLVVSSDPRLEEQLNLQLYHIEDDVLTSACTATTDRYQVIKKQQAMFDTSSRFLYRLVNGTLIRTDLLGTSGHLMETPVIELNKGKTWFVADHESGAPREVIFGHRWCAPRTREWFVIHGDAEGKRYRYQEIKKSLADDLLPEQDFWVSFSANSVLLIMKTRVGSYDSFRYAVIGLDGSVQRLWDVDPYDNDFDLWTEPTGKLHQGKSVLHVTPNGVVKQVFDDLNWSTLKGTERTVKAGDRLLRFAGQLVVVQENGVLSLVKQP